MDLMDNATDPGLEVEGTAVNVDDETTLYIARWNNPEHVKIQAKLLKPYHKEGGDGSISTDQADQVLCRCLADTILKGWTGLKIDGEEITYSVKTSYNLLRDRRFRQFKETVMQLSRREEYFRLKKLEDDLGNLKLPSNGERDGQRNSKSSSKTSKKKSQVRRQRQNEGGSIHT